MMRRLEAITPREFEEEVRRVVAASVRHLKSLEVRHLDAVDGSDGQYTMDVTARFEALGVEFLVLVECKHQKDPVKREVVQVLRDKMQATGAHKGVVFATAPFQKGARDYATQHRIALVHVTDSGMVYISKGVDIGRTNGVPASWIAIPGEESYQSLEGDGLLVLRDLLLE